MGNGGAKIVHPNPTHQYEISSMGILRNGGTFTRRRANGWSKKAILKTRPRLCQGLLIGIIDGV
jgi:hypothetical protein